MIANDNEFQVTCDRTRFFQTQLALMRQMEADPANYHASASGFLAEIDRMQLEVREHLGVHPQELHAATSCPLSI